ncbi:MAG: hypothetical protein OQK50_05625 [Deltaproteobacteria bacterium]|nr:hypothetical protein [Deltaproteobacteria bacterium]MCW9049793.1 hypothetical protein [Deltaproteobacteria bacterium]
MRVFLLSLLLLFFIPSVWAEVKVLELQHRAAEEIVDEVREILDQGEKIQAVGTHLVIVAEGDSLLAAEELVALLDRLPQQFIVRLRHERQQQTTAEKTTLGHGKTTIPSGTTARHLGNSSSAVVQTLRIQEGASGWFEIGSNIPYTKEWSVVTGDISGYSEQTAYMTLKTGFKVQIIQTVGNNVLTLIEPQAISSEDHTTGNPPHTDFSAYRSRIYLPLGEWIVLGTQLQKHDQLGRKIISWRADNRESEKIHFIRIDLAEGFSP